MSKIDKKKKKLQDRIDFLEQDMKSELARKTSSTSEINLPARINEINELRKKLGELK